MIHHGSVDRVISGARTDQYHIDKIHGQDGKVHQRPVCRNGNAPAISSPDLHVYVVSGWAVLGSLIARASGNSTPSKKINCKAFNGFQWLSMAFTADTNPRIPRFWCFISYTKVHHIMVVEDRKW